MFSPLIFCSKLDLGLAKKDRTRLPNYHPVFTVVALLSIIFGMKQQFEVAC